MRYRSKHSSPRRDFSPVPAFLKPEMVLGMVRSRDRRSWRPAWGRPGELRHPVIQTAAGQSFQT